ncbi:ABC transporter substrate-binding protein [Roseiarcaceae bacterium H3SJ34-1]|uniref:ABC transporter substrate-binding protein n=1 Tax=Terripilifer ovatus TaxID=3032367 RepID=UPI003AB9AEF2|nr:ABC transporter substrate-binding protein [Roseiarcaceae bacterium H3SJ34-1]
MPITRRDAVIGGLLAPVALPGIAKAQQQDKVSIGHVMASDFVPLFVGKEKGIFAKHNLDVTNVRVPIIVNIPPAILSGSLQMGAATMPLLLQAVDGGLDLVLIAGASRHLRSQSKIGLMVRSDLKIEKPEDLKGKKIGVAGFNSTMDIFARKWLMTKGINPRDVSFVEAQFPSMPDLLRSGTVDAVTITDPFRTLAVNSKAGYVFAEYFADVVPDALMIGYIATRDWATKNPNVIREFREGLAEANKWTLDNFADAQEIEQKVLNNKSPAPPTLSLAATPQDLQVYIDVGKELGLYNTQLDPKKIVWP